MIDMMKHALVISPTPSHPQDQGNRRRIFEVCKALKTQGYTVHFIWYAHEWGGIINDEYLRDMQQTWDYLYVVPINPNKQNYRKSSKGNSLDEMWITGIDHMIQWCKLNFTYDLVWVNYVLYSKACLRFQDDKTIRIIDAHDVLSNRHILLAKENVEAQFFSLSPEEELKGLKRADIVVAVQEEEEAYYKELGCNTTMTLCHIESTKKIGLSTARNAVGIIGSNNAINIENYKRLVHEIDIVRDSFPSDFKLVVAGTMGDYIPMPLPPYVHKLGRVSCPSIFYEQINIAVIPLEFGTGLKIKAIEALSYGIPILATQHAFIGVESDSPYHNFNTIKALVSDIPDIISDTEILSKLSKKTKVVFNIYKKKLEEQYDNLFLKIDDLLSEKTTSKDEYHPSDEVPPSQPVLIYGAGIGGQYLHNNMPTSFSDKVEGFIDLYKVGQVCLNKPVIHWLDIPQRDRANYFVIVSLTNSEWPKVLKTLQKEGFINIKTAHKYIIAGISQFDDNK